MEDVLANPPNAVLFVSDQPFLGMLVAVLEQMNLKLLKDLFFVIDKGS